MSRAGRRSAAALVAIAASIGLPAGASAEITDVALDGGILEIKASNETERVEATAGGKSVVIDDPGGVPAADAPCKGGAPSSVIRCPRRRVDKVVVELRDGGDRFDGDGDVRFEVNGGSGDDHIHGGDTRDLLEGKLGEDEITGGDGRDQVLGGLDDDYLYGHGGSDLVDGGPGEDFGKGGGGKDHCAGIEDPKRDACERNTKG